MLKNVPRSSDVVLWRSCVSPLVSLNEVMRGLKYLPLLRTESKSMTLQCRGSYFVLVVTFFFLFNWKFVSIHGVFGSFFSFLLFFLPFSTVKTMLMIIYKNGLQASELRFLRGHSHLPSWPWGVRGSCTISIISPSEES